MLSLSIFIHGRICSVLSRKFVDRNSAPPLYFVTIVNQTLGYLRKSPQAEGLVKARDNDCNGKVMRT
jgi:hypothetical protein